jgi:hypothetical protein
MTLGVSLLLVAAGAILIWGVTGEVSGVDLDAIGVILIVVGIIGFVLSLVFWESWGRGGFGRRTRYVEAGAPAPGPTVDGSSRRVVEERVEDYPPAGPPPP